MKGFEKQPLEEKGFIGKLFGGKSTDNAFIEINNFLADCDSPLELSGEFLKEILSKWGAKLNDGSLELRSSIYRKIADRVYSNAQSQKDPLFSEINYIATLLDIPESLQRLGSNSAKKAAYFTRCRNLINNQETLTIQQINDLFNYDYEDGLDSRIQVFHSYFNKVFEEISDRQRFSPQDEQTLRALCQKLDIPYEFKQNIENALCKYQYLWNAENAPLGNVKVDIPLQEQEICHAVTQAGICEHKVVEKVDNYFEMTRKLTIDETISFKGEQIEHPHYTEEITAVIDVGNLFLTNQRIIYLSNKNAHIININDLETANFSVNILYIHQNDGQTFAFKFDDDVAEVIFAILKRILNDNQKK